MWGMSLPMGAIFNCIYAIYFVGLILFTYAYFYGDENAKGWNGTVTRLVFEQTPRCFRAFAHLCGGERAEDAVEGCWDYCVNQRNPIVQILYLAIINAAFFGWLFVGDPLLGSAVLVPPYIQSWMGYVGIAICQISFFAACRNAPHMLTPENIGTYKGEEPFDKLLYLEKAYCEKCKIFKPPRSKHCSLCNVCISHFDHHCIWLNQCVSYKNLNTFMLFLVIHIALLSFFSTIVALILLSEVHEKNLMTRTFINPVTNETYSASYYIVFTYIISKHQTLFCIFCLIVILSICFICFTAYHLVLIYNGTTTNESYKWAHVKKVYQHFKKIGVSKYEGNINNSSSNGTSKITSDNSNNSSSSGSSSSSSSRSVKQKKEVGTTLRGHIQSMEDLNVGCVGSSEAVPSADLIYKDPNAKPSDDKSSLPLPGSSSKVAKDTDCDGDVDGEYIECHVNMVLAAEYEQARHYKHVIRYVIDNGKLPVISEVDVGEFPVNIYDKGVFENFKQALTGYDNIIGTVGGSRNSINGDSIDSNSNNSRKLSRGKGAKSKSGKTKTN